jgi:hypothetical protein
VIDSRIEIYGLKEALNELAQIDKKARWAAINSLKAASSKLVAMAADTFPSDAAVEDQLRGAVHKGRTGYQQNAAKRNVKVKVGGRRTRQGEPVITIVQQDAGAAIFSVAGMRDGKEGKPLGPDRLGRKRQASQSKAYIRNLQRGFGQGQRGIWRAYKPIMKEAEGELMEAIRRVAAKVNRKIVR